MVRNLDIDSPIHDLRYRRLVTFDIGLIDFRYQIPSIFVTFDIGLLDLRYQIQSISTYDIEGAKRRYRMIILYRTSIRYRM
jgi:hypothetical protein